MFIRFDNGVILSALTLRMENERGREHNQVFRFASFTVYGLRFTVEKEKLQTGKFIFTCYTSSRN